MQLHTPNVGDVPILSQPTQEWPAFQECTLGLPLHHYPMAIDVLKSLTLALHHPSSTTESHRHVKLMNTNTISCTKTAGQHTTWTSQEDISIVPNTTNVTKWCSDLASFQSSVPYQNSQRPILLMHIHPSNKILQITTNVKDKLKHFNNKVVRANGSSWHSELDCSEFEANLSYSVRSCLKTNKKATKLTMPYPSCKH